MVASDAHAAAETARALLTPGMFRVYTSDDVAGVELGGALKNIIALGVGISDGLGYGDNAKAAFMTRALAEISRLALAAGANPLTLAGLAGLGDLIATCSSPLSRNRTLGLELAKGRTLEEALAETQNGGGGRHHDAGRAGAGGGAPRRAAHHGADRARALRAKRCQRGRAFAHAA